MRALPGHSINISDETSEARKKLFEKILDIGIVNSHGLA